MTPVSTGLDPTAGVLLQFSQDFAGLGGDNKFIKTTAKVVGERKVFNEEVTLRATLEGGALAWNSGNSRVTDRFILTPSILRGFEPGGIGPRDIGGTANDPLGGNLYLAARFDVEFPLGLPEEYGISGGVFYDVGNLWDLSDVNLNGGTIVGESGAFRHVVGLSAVLGTPRWVRCSSTSQKHSKKKSTTKNRALRSPCAQNSDVMGRVARKLAMVLALCCAGPLAAQDNPESDRNTLVSPVLTIDSERVYQQSAFGQTGCRRRG